MVWWNVILGSVLVKRLKKKIDKELDNNLYLTSKYKHADNANSYSEWHFTFWTGFYCQPVSDSKQFVTYIFIICSSFCCIKRNYKKSFHWSKISKLINYTIPILILILLCNFFTKTRSLKMQSLIAKTAIFQCYSNISVY